MQIIVFWIDLLKLKKSKCRYKICQNKKMIAKIEHYECLIVDFAIYACFFVTKRISKKFEIENVITQYSIANKFNLNLKRKI